MKWQETKQDTEKHSKDYWIDTLVKLQALRISENNALASKLARAFIFADSYGASRP